MLVTHKIDPLGLGKFWKDVNNCVTVVDWQLFARKMALPSFCIISPPSELSFSSAGIGVLGELSDHQSYSISLHLGNRSINQERCRYTVGLRSLASHWFLFLFCQPCICLYSSSSPLFNRHIGFGWEALRNSRKIAPPLFTLDSYMDPFSGLNHDTKAEILKNPSENKCIDRSS